MSIEKIHEHIENLYRDNKLTRQGYNAIIKFFDNNKHLSEYMLQQRVASLIANDKQYVIDQLCLDKIKELNKRTVIKIKLKPSTDH